MAYVRIQKICIFIFIGMTLNCFLTGCNQKSIEGDKQADYYYVSNLGECCIDKDSGDYLYFDKVQCFTSITIDEKEILFDNGGFLIISGYVHHSNKYIYDDSFYIYTGTIENKTYINKNYSKKLSEAELRFGSEETGEMDGRIYLVYEISNLIIDNFSEDMNEKNKVISLFTNYYIPHYRNYVIKFSEIEYI
ncbi:MAG: hypothetical protein WCR54_06020 [Clostridia bacterium]